MNLPNKLTVGRLVLTVLFLIVFFGRSAYADTIALALFILASLTDYYDGEIARKRNLITNFGILMDPLADKILTCSAFIAFVEHKDNVKLVTFWGVNDAVSWRANGKPLLFDGSNRPKPAFEAVIAETKKTSDAK